MAAPGSAAAVSRAVTCPPSSALTVRSAADSSRAASAVRCAARRPPPRGAGSAGAGAAGLAGDQEHLAGEQVPPGGEVGEERGVVEGGGFQVRVGERGGGVFQVGDRGGQVGVAGPDEDLDRAGEGVQPPAVRGGQRVLLGRGPQREVDR